MIYEKHKEKRNAVRKPCLPGSSERECLTEETGSPSLSLSLNPPPLSLSLSLSLFNHIETSEA